MANWEERENEAHQNDGGTNRENDKKNDQGRKKYSNFILSLFSPLRFSLFLVV